MTLNRSFFLLTTAFLLMVTSAITLAIALGGKGSAATLYTAGIVSALVAGFLLRTEARRDLDAVLTLVIAFLAGLAIFVVIYVLAALRPGIAPKITAVLAVAATLTLGIWSYRRQRTESRDYPNLLARSVDPRSIFESEGVQFTGFLEAGTEGRPHFITVLLQNCFDGPCEVTMNFDPASYAKYLQFYARHKLTLGGGEVVKVRLPVVTPTYPGSYPLYYSIDVKKQQGKRVRLWRSQEATTRVKPGTQLAMLAVGHLTWGGGIYFKIGPLPYDLWNVPLPAPVVESLWQPRREWISSG